MKSLFRKLLYFIAAIGFSASQAGSFEDFFRAVQADKPAVVQQLLERGFDPNTTDEKGQTGLVLALRGDALQTAAVLLSHPSVRVDQPNGSNETPLMMAALHGRLDWVQRLLERGAQVNRDGWTPLHYAATGPEPKVVSLLLDRGAHIDAPSPNGSTPLMMAARYGNPDSALLLLGRGADPKLRNEKSMTAADFARSAGRDALAQQLAAPTR